MDNQIIKIEFKGTYSKRGPFNKGMSRAAIYILQHKFEFLFRPEIPKIPYLVNVPHNNIEHNIIQYGGRMLSI